MAFENIDNIFNVLFGDVLGFFDSYRVVRNNAYVFAYFLRLGKGFGYVAYNFSVGKLDNSVGIMLGELPVVLNYYHKTCFG